MQRCRKADYQHLIARGFHSRQAGPATRSRARHRLAQANGEVYRQERDPELLRFQHLLVLEHINRAAVLRREALHWRAIAAAGWEPHPSQFPQRRVGVLMHGYDDLYRHYLQLAREAANNARTQRRANTQPGSPLAIAASACSSTT